MLRYDKTNPIYGRGGFAVIWCTIAAYWEKMDSRLLGNDKNGGNCKSDSNDKKGGNDIL